MNKIRIIGAVIAVLGIGAKFVFEDHNVEYLYAVPIGLGIGMLLTGRTAKRHQDF